jgi:hypothetical protein
LLHALELVIQMDEAAVANRAAEALAPPLPSLVRNNRIDGNRSHQTSKALPEAIWEELNSILQAHPDQRARLDSIAAVPSTEERQSALIPILLELMGKQHDFARRLEEVTKQDSIKDAAELGHRNSTSERPDPPSSKLIPLIGGALAAAFPFLSTWFATLDLSRTTKRLIIWVIVVALVLAAYAYLRRLARARRPLEWFLNLIALITVISIIGLVPSLIFDRNTQALLLKFLAIIILALLPGWLYVQFVVVKGKSLRDEFVLDLYRLHADSYGNLPAPPKGSIFYPIWRAIPDKPPDDRRNMYLQKLQSAYGRVVAVGHTEEDPGRFQGIRFHRLFFSQSFLQ